VIAVASIVFLLLFFGGLAAALVGLGLMSQ
jgi:hypothetical protein